MRRNWHRRALNRLVGGRAPEGVVAQAKIARAGHRLYVGGEWDQVGELQFDFLVNRGLRPEHVLLDIACGSLRGGVHFIRYLNPGNYLGIEKEQALIRSGLEKELPHEVNDEKRPEFVVSDTFEFDRFSRHPDFSLAQSLFTHLLPPEIELCMSNLRKFVAPGHELYATFQAGESEQNPSRWHPHLRFRYTIEEFAGFGERNGFEADFIGDWGHPRGQLMMQFNVR